MRKIAIISDQEALAGFLVAELADAKTICLPADFEPRYLEDFAPGLVLRVLDAGSAAEAGMLPGQVPLGLIRLPPCGPLADGEASLDLPFSGAELRAFVDGFSADHRADNQVMLEIDADRGGMMDNSGKKSVVTLELEDMVEEGLPLTDLEPSATADAGELEIPEIVETSAEVEIEDFTLEDFSGDLEDLEKELADSEPVAAPATENDGAADKMPESSPESSDDQSDPLPAGDLDALLSDEEFTEIDVRNKVRAEDFEDSVLADLKSAGLRPESDALLSDDELETGGQDGLEAADDEGFSIDELSELDQELPAETAVVEDDGQLDTPDDESVPACRQARPAESLPEFPEESPDDYLLPEDSFSEPSIEQSAAQTQASEEYSLLAELTEENAAPEGEAPEEAAGRACWQAGESPEEDKIEPAPRHEISTAENERTATAEIFHEPASPDFSGEIEGLTREWSKQLLQTTYASMDKMIKAIGDLAPTIVDQVAREVIPPLAEKVIKAEIAKLEAKLEEEDEEEN